MQFLDPNNVAGQSLLQLVARGSSILCELLRLSDHIPPVFLGGHEAAKYASILYDFKYLKAAEAYDEQIDSNPDTIDIDEEFKENHIAILERFYTLFDSIYRYIENFCSYIHDMHNGAFLQHTVEGVIMDTDGKQLMCEALYLYGCMLLLLDMRIPGPARERMIVAYYRHKGNVQLLNFDAVCRLCRDTGFRVNEKRPNNYPDDYFARIPIDPELIDMVLGRLRADDIYNHTTALPMTAHRTFALSTQASMLYVCLYFAPQILHNNNGVCREIVDKFFADNWVISIYMGYVVDLFDVWEPYKAARTALRTTLTPEVIKNEITNHQTAVANLLKGLDEYLTQGVLTEDFLMDNQRVLMNHIRSCNFTLRWLLLHRCTGQVAHREKIRAAVTTADVLRLLMNASQLEFLFKTLTSRILETKETRWNRLKTQIANDLTELSEVYGGTNSLRRVKKNEKLRAWFEQLATTIKEIDPSHSVSAGRTLGQMLHAIEEVQSFHQIEGSLQVKQALIEIKGMLTGMVRLANITHKLIADFDIIVEFAYAKKVITMYTPLIHEQIARDPSVCLLLRATFLKLSSILSLPLVRITQAGSKDDVSVAEYYSTELINYVRSVLEIVPISVFKILDKITEINTTKLTSLQAKIERKYLKDAAQLYERYSLAKLTYNVSVFTRGILNMHTTLLGILKLDPRQALQDGIRKQLVHNVASAMNEHLLFESGKIEDFEARIQALGRKLAGFQQSIEYIQDYINAYGLKMWQEEFSRIINYNVEQESNEFLKKKIYDWQSQYQSDAIPIPIFERPKHPQQSRFVNFTGRVVNELLLHTRPQIATYIPYRQGWYSLSEMREYVGLRTFSLLRQGLGVYGLCGLDRLLCFMIAKELGAFCKLYRKIVSAKGIAPYVAQLANELHPTTQFPLDANKLYAAALAKTEKIWPYFLEYITKFGQAQLLRRHFVNELNFALKLDSKVLGCALETFNLSLMTDIRAHYASPEGHPYPQDTILQELTKYLDIAGCTEPALKIYITTTDPLPSLPLVMFLFTLFYATKLQWHAPTSTLVSTDKKLPLDGAPFVLGIATFLKQFHTSHTHMFLNYIGQFIRAQVSTSSTSKNPQLPNDVVKMLLFLEEFCKSALIPRRSVDAVVPAYLFDSFPRV